MDVKERWVCNIILRLFAIRILLALNAYGKVCSMNTFKRNNKETFCAGNGVCGGTQVPLSLLLSTEN